MEHRWIGGLVAAHSEPQRIQRRYHEQRQRGGNEQAAHDGDGHGTPEDAAGERDHSQDGGEGGENHWTRTPHGRVDDRAMAAVAGRDIAVDLIDQDHGVAHDHAGERNQPEQGHEAERPIGDDERGGLRRSARAARSRTPRPAARSSAAEPSKSPASRWPSPETRRATRYWP